MTRVRFNEHREVRDHLGKVVASFAAGEVVELSAASAKRWLRREAAELVAKSVKLGLPPGIARPPAGGDDVAVDTLPPPPRPATGGARTGGAKTGGAKTVGAKTGAAGSGRSRGSGRGR